MGTGTVVGTAATCTNVATFTVVASDNPIITVPTASVCQFHNVTLSASGAQTYVWSPSNTLNSATGSTVIASPTVTTVYSVIGSSLNCQSPTQQTTVDVVANPVIVIAPVTPTICAGSPIGLTAFGATNYTWTPAIAINTVNGNFVIVNPTVTTVYQVLGEAATCTSTAVRMVSVIPLPDLQAVSDRTIICAGDKLNINANGAVNYTWSPAVALSGIYTNFVIANPMVPITYTIVGDNGICKKTITFSIDVKVRPVLNLSTDKPKICQGQSATIFASGCSGYSIHPNPWTNITNSTSAVVTPTASFNFSVTGYNGDSIYACPFTKEILITVVPTITAGASWNSGVCEGGSVKLEAEGSNSYQWTPYEGLNNPNTRTPYASPKVTTVYTVIVSDMGMCPQTATTEVKVHPQPTVNAGPDAVYNSDEQIFLNAKGTGTLSWIFGDNIICSVCPQSQITPTRSGVYQVRTTNEFGCTATDDVWIEITNDYPIFIPNSFTPNYDGLNDVFLVYGQSIIEFEMMIFDRWQHQIFSSTDQMKGWDGVYKGQIVKNDSYIYVINYKTYDGKKHTKTGYVLVVREDY